jgi:hypothetical protein
LFLFSFLPPLQPATRQLTPFHLHSDHRFDANNTKILFLGRKMTERITDEQVADLIALLRTDASIDIKVQQVTAVKSSIKQHTVPETCIVPVFEALHTASSSQHANLVNAGFTSLNHLFTRLVRQDPRTLAKEGARTLPLIVEKLGDLKEKFRQLAAQALVTLYKVAPVEVERSVRNIAMVGKNPRAKEASMHWLLQVRVGDISTCRTDELTAAADASRTRPPIPSLRPDPNGVAGGRRRHGARCGQIDSHSVVQVRFGTQFAQMTPADRT